MHLPLFLSFFLIRDWCVEGSFLQQQKGISVTTVVESKPESSSRKRRSSCSREDSHLSSGNFPLSILLSWDGHYSGRKEMQGYCSILRARWENLIQNMYWWVLSLLNSTSFRREGLLQVNFIAHSNSAPIVPGISSKSFNRPSANGQVFSFCLNENCHLIAL